MTLIRDVIDGLYTNFLRLGRGSSEIALKPSSNLLELRNVGDTAYANFRAGVVTADSLVLGTPIASVACRQCLMLGSVDSSGRPNALINPLNLTMQLGGNGNLVFSFADGFDSSGSPIDYLASLPSSTTLAANANTTTYFYVERSGSTVTLNKTAIAPIYSRTAPTSPATGLHWFNTNQNTNGSQTGMKMFEWTGSAWTARQRIFVGEAVAGGSSVSSFACYAYQRRYQSPWTGAIAAGSTVNFAHNLGMTLAQAEANAMLYGRTSSSDSNQAVVLPYFYAGAGFGVRWLTSAPTRLNQSFLLGDSAIYFDSAGGSVGSAELQLVVNGGW